MSTTAIQKETPSAPVVRAPLAAEQLEFRNAMAVVLMGSLLCTPMKHGAR